MAGGDGADEGEAEAVAGGGAVAFGAGEAVEGLGFEGVGEAGAGVGDDDLVDASGERREAAREETLLVADDERGGDSGADGSATLARAGRPRTVNPGRGPCGRGGGGA